MEYSWAEGIPPSTQFGVDSDAYRLVLGRVDSESNGYSRHSLGRGQRGGEPANSVQRFTTSVAQCLWLMSEVEQVWTLVPSTFCPSAIPHTGSLLL